MEINAMTRFEKLKYLVETCNEEFIKDCTMLHAMVDWMSADDFSEFFNKLCNDWNIVNPEEEDEMNEFTVEGTEMIFTA